MKYYKKYTYKIFNGGFVIIRKSCKLYLILIIFILLIALYIYNSINLLKLSIHGRELNYFDNKLNGGLLPTADFTVDSITIFLGEDVYFNYTGIDGDLPMTYIWDFGDASPKSTEKKPTHHYEACGSFTINLTVIDGDGDTDSEVKEDYILVELLPLIANFESALTIVDVGDSIQFTFTGFSYYPPTEFLWTFGDGKSSTNKNPTHQYFYAGKFTVRLRVTETSLNRSDTTTKVDYIQVWEREDTQDDQEEVAIPGYNLLILIGVVSVISLKLFKNHIS